MTSTLVTPPAAPAPYANLSVARRVIRHVVACHIENLAEGDRAISLSYLVACASDSIHGDHMWADYYPHITDRRGAAARRLLARSFSDPAIEREARWLLKQDLKTIARFILTAEAGELTEQGIEGAARHEAWLTRFDAPRLIAAARAQYGI